MSPSELSARWAQLTREERRFVRVVAGLGETAGTDAGNELVAAYAARRLHRFRLAAQALVAVASAAYLTAAFTLLSDASATALGAVAVVGAAAQAAWILRAERRLQHTIAVNRSA